MITIHTLPEQDIEKSYFLYCESFPPKERRKWDDILQRSADNKEPFQLLGVYSDYIFAGFITMWTFSDFRYIEHFAIEPTMRSHGIGSEVLANLIAESTKPIVLEVELPQQSDIAIRRINFYSRCGFTPHPEYEYIQPPYAANLPAVPLMLMATSYLDLDAVTHTLHKQVYNVI